LAFCWPVVITDSGSPVNMMPLPPEAPAPAHTLLHLLRLVLAAGGALRTQGGLHGELARIEWAEERIRLLQMLVALLLGVVFLMVGLVCISALVLVLAWDTPYRMAALVLLVAFHGCGVGIAWWRFRILSARSEQAFAATREELAADFALLGSKS
jgi:uncharacterized membrane protein YqjE